MRSFNNCRLRVARNVSRSETDGWLYTAQQVLYQAFGEESWPGLVGAVSIANVFTAATDATKPDYAHIAADLHEALPACSAGRLQGETTGLLRMSRPGRIRLAVRLDLPALVRENSAAIDYLAALGLADINQKKSSPHFVIGSVLTELYKSDMEHTDRALNEIRSLIPATVTLDPVYSIVNPPTR